jgi:hypothetical protein
VPVDLSRKKNNNKTSGRFSVGVSCAFAKRRRRKPRKTEEKGRREKLTTGSTSTEDRLPRHSFTYLFCDSPSSLLYSGSSRWAVRRNREAKHAPVKPGWGCSGCIRRAWCHKSEGSCALLLLCREDTGNFFFLHVISFLTIDALIGAAQRTRTLTLSPCLFFSLSFLM